MTDCLGDARPVPAFTDVWKNPPPVGFILFGLEKQEGAKAIHLVLFITLNATFFVISHGARTVVHVPDALLLFTFVE